MMKGAYEIPGLRFTGIAKNEIPLHRFCKAVAEGDNMFDLCGEGEQAIGVSRNHSNVAEPIEVADGICIVEASAAIAAGAKVSAAADGKAVTASSGIVNGIALTAATAAGQYVAVKLV